MSLLFMSEARTDQSWSDLKGTLRTMLLTSTALRTSDIPSC